MSQTILETEAANKYAVVVKFSWGTSNEARYCRWDRPLTVGGEVYTPEPTIKVTFDKPLHGGTDDTPVELQIRSTIAPIATLINPRPHAKVIVRIEEVVPGDGAATRQLIYKGQVVKASANPRRRGEMATLKIASPKARLSVSLGVQALSTCPWTFGDRHCDFDLDAAKITGTITELDVNGKLNRIRFEPDSTPSNDQRNWRRGFIEVDKLRITVRKLYVQDVSGTSAVRIDLVSPPPAAWLDEEASLAPGCDKQIDTCKFHGQESQFAGIGIKMPDRNPVFEVR